MGVFGNQGVAKTIIKAIFVCFLLVNMVLIIVPVISGEKMPFCSVYQVSGVQNGGAQDQQLVGAAHLGGQYFNLPIKSPSLLGGEKRAIGHYVIGSIYLAGLIAAAAFVGYKRCLDGGMYFIYGTHVIAAVALLSMMGVYGPVCNGLKWSVPTKGKNPLLVKDDVGIKMFVASAAIGVYFGLMAVILVYVKRKQQSSN